MESLDLTLRGPRMGRPAEVVVVESSRPLTAADLELLVSAPQPQRPLMRLRDRHHMLARCLAQGMTNVQASLITGYAVASIPGLRADPAFTKLIADYRDVENELFAEFTARATTLSLSAMNEIQERLDDSPEEIGTSMLLEIGKFAADRTGHAPVTKNINLNVNAELGDKLRAARERLMALEVEP